MLFNHGLGSVRIKQGEHIAQLIIEKIALLEVILIDERDRTQRGDKGFGSTGVAPLTEDNVKTKAPKGIAPSRSEEELFDISRPACPLQVETIMKLFLSSMWQTNG